MLLVGALCITSIWWADQLYRDSLAASRQLNDSNQTAERLHAAIRERAHFARKYANDHSDRLNGASHADGEFDYLNLPDALDTFIKR